jgi:hypothetical protein
VQARQQRPAALPLDEDPLRVHRHVEQAAHEAEREQCEEQGDGLARKRRQHERQAQEREADPHHAPAAVQVDERARDPRAYEQPDREPDERRSENAVAQPELGLDRGQPRRPRARDGRVDEERGCHAAVGAHAPIITG